MTEAVDLSLLSFEEDIEKAIEFFNGELAIIKVGRANPRILDKVVVDYYGTMTPINQMANISIPEARMMLISVWDQSQVKAVSKAIEAANLGVNPSDDGRVIRLVFPALTEERRREVVKDVNRLTENAKVSCRNARRDVLDEFKKMKKNNELTEDELASLEKDVQKMLDSAIEKIDKMSASKEASIAISKSFPVIQTVFPIVSSNNPSITGSVEFTATAFSAFCIADKISSLKHLNFIINRSF